MSAEKKRPEAAESGKAEVSNKENRILTIPNLMSLFRLMLIPVIMWAYLGMKNYWLVAGLLILSGLTDVADGFVARHFNQISALGKVLDPVADKFTEGILMILLALRYPLLWMDVVIFAVGSFLMSFWGLRAIERQHFGLVGNTHVTQLRAERFEPLRQCMCSDMRQACQFGLGHRA